jgi:hypothetical protein
MVAVQDIRKCPQCGKDANYELQLRDLTELLFCFYCGYHFWTSVVIKGGRNQKGVNYFKLTKDGKRIYRVYERRGYGTYTFDNRGRETVYRFKTDGLKRNAIIADLKKMRDTEDFKIKISIADGNKISEE